MFWKAPVVVGDTVNERIESRKFRGIYQGKLVNSQNSSFCNDEWLV